MHASAHVDIGTLLKNTHWYIQPLEPVMIYYNNSHQCCMNGLLFGQKAMAEKEQGIRLQLTIIESSGLSDGGVAQ